MQFMTINKCLTFDMVGRQMHVNGALIRLVCRCSGLSRTEDAVKSGLCSFLMTV